jgi:MarR family transcriptional regulator, lower aerobic nicotinate degradation pathway regulator
MTPAGRKALGTLRATAASLENQLLTPLDKSERQELHGLLLRLAEHHLPGCKLGSFQPPSQP